MVTHFESSRLILSSVVGALIVMVACTSGESSSEFPGDGKQDAEVDAPGPLLPDGGTKPDTSFEAGPSSCPPTALASFTPTWKAPSVVQNACSSPELKLYYDSCLANPAKTEPDGTCAKFKTDHKACGDCAEPADNTGAVQWYQNRKFYGLNIGGCIAIAQNELGSDKCGAAFSAAVQCSRASCDYCFASGGTFAQYTDCQTMSKTTGSCKTYDSTAQTACAGYSTADSGAAKCVKGTAEDPSVYYPRLVGVICGPP